MLISPASRSRKPWLVALLPFLLFPLGHSRELHVPGIYTQEAHCIVAILHLQHAALCLLLQRQHSRWLIAALIELSSSETHNTLPCILKRSAPTATSLLLRYYLIDAVCRAIADIMCKVPFHLCPYSVQYTLLPDT
ncbi:hypothetical protein V8F20_010066 [Naviculisporaceae sp. PSN 640]